MKPLKIKYIEVSAQILADICKRAVKNKLPYDAKVLRVNYNVLTNNFEAVIYSEEYPEISEGTLIPKLEEFIISKDVLK